VCALLSHARRPSTGGGRPEHHGPAAAAACVDPAGEELASSGVASARDR
jgi:hypothetical protein